MTNYIFLFIFYVHAQHKMFIDEHQQLLSFWLNLIEINLMNRSYRHRWYIFLFAWNLFLSNETRFFPSHPNTVTPFFSQFNSPANRMINTKWNLRKKKEKRFFFLCFCFFLSFGFNFSSFHSHICIWFIISHNKP